MADRVVACLALATHSNTFKMARLEWFAGSYSSSLARDTCKMERLGFSCRYFRLGMLPGPPFFGLKYRQDGEFSAVLSVFLPLFCRKIPTRWNFPGWFAGIFGSAGFRGPPAWRILKMYRTYKKAHALVA
jgi:hypothetical protein